MGTQASPLVVSFLPHTLPTTMADTQLATNHFNTSLPHVVRTCCRARLPLWLCSAPVLILGRHRARPSRAGTTQYREITLQGAGQSNARSTPRTQKAKGRCEWSALRLMSREGAYNPAALKASAMSWTNVNLGEKVGRLPARWSQ